MDKLGRNKLFAAILMALIGLSVSGLVAQYVVKSPAESQQAFVIAVPDDSSEGAGNQTSVASAAAVIDPVEPLLAAASIERGAEVFRKCVQCHTIEKGEGHKIGPNLWGIVGKGIAQSQGFMYSAVLSQKAGDVWSYEHLNIFLAQPQTFARGTKMSFVGLKKVQDRADLIAYLRTKSEPMMPLP